ncbi:hypothetical protein HZS38_01735 [Xenorhabdus nematophila]|uniref:hypothetical protein n=1 Tax=Xenorhabdus nematophila TaxID=628 RepID=UPI000541DC00|nr:hypothetical protein [Xenorhabdus nematophila]MBA0017977.1 hypothetical protein [Xenorhabdus nematophila]MCB4427009.1 hypothetical protein [Xenorhabdus nematophila]QNJ37063.1 hypothetical protein H8F46_02035 [Xenorhabdus nematophila]CEF31336.1 hypothetical protein XNW1_3370007 [Xenorhabdus nematophila str. Websteri]
MEFGNNRFGPEIADEEDEINTGSQKVRGTKTGLFTDPLSDEEDTEYEQNDK